MSLVINARALQLLSWPWLLNTFRIVEEGPSETWIACVLHIPRLIDGNGPLGCLLLRSVDVLEVGPKRLGSPIPVAGGAGLVGVRLGMAVRGLVVQGRLGLVGGWGAGRRGLVEGEVVLRLRVDLVRGGVAGLRRGVVGYRLRRVV